MRARPTRADLIKLLASSGVRFDYNRYGMEDSQGFSIAYFHRFQL